MVETIKLLTLCLFSSLYTYEGHQVTDGNQLESGQLYVAVGRERFKKLPYSDLLFTKPRGTRRVNGWALQHRKYVRVTCLNACNLIENMQS